MATKYYTLFTTLKEAGDKGVSPENCAKVLGTETFAPILHTMKTKFGANIVSKKDGKKVLAYILTNPEKLEGVLTPEGKKRGRTPNPVKPVRTVTKQAGELSKSVEEGIVQILDKELEIADFSEREFNDIKSQLGL